MKDHKVQITRTFKDLEENLLREIGTETEVFMCTKERYEILSSKDAVKLLNIIEKEQPKKEIVKKEEIKTQPKKKTTKNKTKIDKK
jgi:hypothetical protein